MRWILALAFSPNGQLLASGGDDPGVILWNVTTEGVKELRSLPQDARTPPITLAFSSDGQHLAVGCSGNATIHVYDLKEEDSTPVPLSGHSGSVMALAFAPKGLHLVSASSDRTLRLWNLATAGKAGVVFKYPAVHWINSLGFARNTGRLFSAGQDTTVRQWALEGEPREVPAPLVPPLGSTLAVAFAPDGKALVSANDGEEPLRQWALGREIRMAALGNRTSVGFLLASAEDGQTLAACGNNGATVQIWRTEASRTSETDLPVQPPIVPGGTRVLALTLAPDGKTVATGNLDSSVRICSLAGPKANIWQPWSGHAGPVLAVAFAPDGKLLAAASAREIRLWNVETSRQVYATSTGAPVSVLAFAPDGKTLALGGNDLQLWEVKNNQVKPGSLARLARSHTGPVTGLAFSVDGSRLASAGLDGHVLVHRTTTGQSLANIRLPGPIKGLAFATDGRHIATANGNDTVSICRVK
jgi:WD40 repeat protein